MENATFVVLEHEEGSMLQLFLGTIFDRKSKEKSYEKCNSIKLYSRNFVI